MINEEVGGGISSYNLTNSLLNRSLFKKQLEIANVQCQMSVLQIYNATVHTE